MPGLERCWNADHQDVGQGLERHWGGNGYTPMGLCCRDDGTEVEHRSKAEVHSYPSQRHDADCQSDQCIHIEIVMTTLKKVSDFVYFLPFLFSL